MSWCGGRTFWGVSEVGGQQGLFVLLCEVRVVAETDVVLHTEMYTYIMLYVH